MSGEGHQKLWALFAAWDGKLRPIYGWERVSACDRDDLAAEVALAAEELIGDEEDFDDIVAREVLDPGTAGPRQRLRFMTRRHVSVEVSPR